jgi:hypothetical protein
LANESGARPIDAHSDIVLYLTTTPNKVQAQFWALLFWQAGALQKRAFWDPDPSLEVGEV